MRFTQAHIRQDDLLQFHNNHFGKAFVGASTTTGTDHGYQTDHPLQYDENDLGHYSDGCARTLTDEQIEIFRHSEIQRLLLKQRRDAEAAAEADSEQEVDEDVESPAAFVDDHKSSRKLPKASRAKIPKKYREQFIADTEKFRNRSRQQHQDAYDRNVSTRRRVRELDDITRQDDIVLDY